MGLFDRLKKGLARTRQKITTGFRTVLRIGQKIDQETIVRLEDAMLSADFGPATTAKLIEVVRTGWKAGEIAEEQEVTA
jgi:fused signal recognition particle receptor